MMANERETLPVPGGAAPSMAAMQAQLDRIEAQNRSILRTQRLRLVLTCLFAAGLCAVIALLWQRVDAASAGIAQASREVEQLAGRVQEKLDELDPDSLQKLVEALPEVTEKLKQVDVEALNEALRQLPALMKTVTDMQERVQSIQDWFGNLGSLGGLFGH